MHQPAMEQTSLFTFVQFNNWANQRLLDQAAALNEEALNEQSPFFDHGTAFQTLCHHFEVEWSWLRAAQGIIRRTSLWDGEPLADLAAIQRFARRFGPELAHYAANLSPGALAEHVDIGTPNGLAPEWVRRADILLHLVNHGTVHRTELAHFLTSKGHSPGELDYLDFAIEAGK